MTTAGGPIPLVDRLAADALGKSYREFLTLKPTHYRWSHLAIQAVEYLDQAHEGQWSMEKLADYLNCPVEEAESCLRRFVMSKRVHNKEGTATRIKQSIFEWTGRFSELGERERERCAAELSLLVGNQLFAAVRADEAMDSIAKELEGPSAEEVAAASAEQKKREKIEEARRWGPQWKDNG